MKEKFFLFLIIFFIFLFIFIAKKGSEIPKENINEKEEVIIETQGKEEILIGIISDTHIPKIAKQLPSQIEEVFKGVDYIIHCGDISDFKVLRDLEKIAPVFAVRGNGDVSKWAKEKIPVSVTLKIFDYKIHSLHSYFPYWFGSHFNFLQKLSAMAFVKNQDFNILIFGHTHRPYLKYLNFKGKKILLINPGSPVFPVLSKASVAILKIKKDYFEGKIIYLSQE